MGNFYKLPLSLLVFAVWIQFWDVRRDGHMPKDCTNWFSHGR
jgi:hypothetical protein